ncbi:heterokaryon incompatibility protein-domain-containing protein [Lasiosphaeris hirsuta]|uniref:Heterokaryon incompatibility protein-domain-containing protein n=1 Tax=Lasiosphaeris hirsuta TaxID=260670 RepID=A0AA39ZS27_9PEZI|nr:heterokaryon incompatibility protein-domain-containing protein [Lasiosphaeris hirsuta]
MDLARLWLDDCARNHKSCRIGSSPLPKRVLHVGSDEAEPRLHISCGEQGKYIALSHCWGDRSLLMTTENATLEQREQAIPFVHLPKTFQDAITVARALGIEYLWIDSLCIVQDDEADWDEESMKMADIYSHATLTISADDASNATEGFLGLRNDPRAKMSIPIAYSAELGHEDGTIYARRGAETRKREKYDNGFYALADTHVGAMTVHHLDTRGWTFQERLLAPRTLHYTAAEMVFECKEDLDLEPPNSPIHDYSRYSPVRSSPIWSTIVQNFTSRNLTLPKDRLPAVAGVAMSFQPYTDEDYLYGL